MIVQDTMQYLSQLDPEVGASVQRVCRWFQKPVAAGDKLIQVRDLAGLHAARLGAQGDAEGLSSGEGIL